MSPALRLRVILTFPQQDLCRTHHITHSANKQFLVIVARNSLVGDVKLLIKRQFDRLYPEEPYRLEKVLYLRDAAQYDLDDEFLVGDVFEQDFVINAVGQISEESAAKGLHPAQKKIKFSDIGVESDHQHPIEASQTRTADFDLMCMRNLNSDAILSLVRKAFEDGTKSTAPPAPPPEKEEPAHASTITPVTTPVALLECAKKVTAAPAPPQKDTFATGKPKILPKAKTEMPSSSSEDEIGYAFLNVKQGAIVATEPKRPESRILFEANLQENSDESSDEEIEPRPSLFVPASVKDSASATSSDSSDESSDEDSGFPRALASPIPDPSELPSLIALHESIKRTPTPIQSLAMAALRPPVPHPKPNVHGNRPPFNRKPNTNNKKMHNNKHQSAKPNTPANPARRPAKPRSPKNPQMQSQAPTAPTQPAPAVVANQ